MSASRTIKLRSRVVETTEAVPELGSITPIDTGSDNERSERAVSPAPEIVTSRRPDDDPILRHPSPELEMEDQDSPTRRHGFGSIESGLVSEPAVSTGITSNKVNEPEKKSKGVLDSLDNWRKREDPPHLAGRGRGTLGVRFHPNIGHARLSEEQIATATEAEAATPREFARVTQRQSSESVSLGEGPSRLMEKSRHPLDFGGIDFEPGEDDPEIQLAILKAYKEAANKKIVEAKKRVRANRARDELAATGPALPKTPNEQAMFAQRQSTEVEPSSQTPFPISNSVDNAVRGIAPEEYHRAHPP